MDSLTVILIRKDTVKNFLILLPDTVGIDATVSKEAQEVLFIKKNQTSLMLRLESYYKPGHLHVISGLTKL